MSKHCLICNKDFKIKYPYHLKTVHGLSVKEYYDKYVKSDGEGFCSHCNSPTEFSQRYFKYKKFCSQSCNMAYSHQEIKNDPVKKEAKRKKNSQIMKKMWSDPDQRSKWVRQFSDFQKENGKINEIIAEKRKDSDYDQKFRERMGKNGFVSLWKKEDFRELRKECASKQSVQQIADPNNKWGTRTGKMVEYNGTIFRSSWELTVAQLLDEKGIDWTYESQTFQYKGNRRYTPDFYLKEFNLFLEVKPETFVDEEVIDKLDSVETEGFNTLLITENNLET